MVCAVLEGGEAGDFVNSGNADIQKYGTENSVLLYFPKNYMLLRR